MWPGWRVPLALSAVVVGAQLVPVEPLLDVTRGGAPPGVHLAWPITHVLLAPLTLLADWLNGGSRADLEGFAAWTLVGYVLWRLARRAAAPRRGPLAEAGSAVVFCLSLSAFVWWGVRWNRPIPRLVAGDSALVIFDTHSHTARSHDGRPGFDAAANARWHARAGFDVAFLTDHNAAGGAGEWGLERAGRPPRLLGGEELSLAGLHVLVLGSDTLIRNEPWASSFDSSVALLAAIGRPAGAAAGGEYLIASLPEFWEHHWGSDLGRLLDAGVRGFEVWTTSPRAMEFPPAARRTLIARARGERLALFGATDMHGWGNTASVWNVAPLPGWRGLGDAVLTRELLDLFRDRPEAIRVVALRRYLPASRLARAFGAPLGLFTALRAASRAHGVLLLAWIWGIALLSGRRRAPPDASSA